MTNKATSNIELWSALPTPFLADGALDDEGLRINIRRCIDVGLQGVYCNGLMGEVWSLSIAERKKVLEVIVDEAGQELSVSPVTSTADLGETIDLTRHAKETGAAYAVLVAPGSARSDAEVLSYFSSVMSAVDMPYVVFNPGTPGTDSGAVSPEAFAHLCREPNFRILKTTTNSQMNDRMRAIAQGTHVRVSDPLEENFLHNLITKGQTLLYCDPEGYLYQTPDSRPIEKYVLLAQAGRMTEARDVFDSLRQLRSIYRKWIIGPLESGMMPNAALKLWCEFIGMVGGPVRGPVVELTEVQANELAQELTEAFAINRGVQPAGVQ